MRHRLKRSIVFFLCKLFDMEGNPHSRISNQLINNFVGTMIPRLKKFIMFFLCELFKKMIRDVT